MTTEMTLRESEAAEQWDKLLSSPIERFAPAISLSDEFDGMLTESGLVIKVLEMPHPISWEKDGEIQAAMVMTVELRGEERTLYLSSESIKRSMGYFIQRFGSKIVGQTFHVTRRYYDNKQYGKTVAYDMRVYHPVVTETDMEYKDGEIKPME